MAKTNLSEGQKLAEQIKADGIKLQGSGGVPSEGQVLADQMRKDIESGELNINPETFEAATRNVISNANPTNPSGFEEEYTPEQKEYDQGFLTDAASGMWNSLVIGGGEGLANLAPTIAQAAGVESEYVDNWKTNVSNWFEAQESIYSDRANQPIEEFSDINSSHVGQALGQGVGFILGIMGGGGAIGALGKTTKGIDMARKVGSFFSGTTLMYPMIDKEAQEAGLSKANASRFALGVSGIVSMTEGAALEWIGKSATRGLTKGLTKKAVQQTLKSSAGKTPKELQQLFTKNLGDVLKGKGSIVAESAAVEFGQEFSQTYIEEGAKAIWDGYSKGEKGNFETGSFNVFNDEGYKKLVESTFGGLIGAVLGGAMGGASIAKSGVQKDDSIDQSLAKESLFGYINTSIKSGNTENIDKLYTSIDEMTAKGEMTESQSAAAKVNIDKLAQFSQDTKSINIDNGITQYQLFQLDSSKKKSTAVKDSIEVSENSNDAFKKVANEKKSKIELVEERVQENFDSLVESKKPEEKNKVKFEDKIVKYDDLTQKINKENISEEQVKIELDKIYNPTKIAEKKAKKEAAKKESKESTQSTESTDSTKPTEFGKEYKTEDGGTVTDFAVENRQEILDDYLPKIRDAKDDSAKEAALAEVKDKFGIDKEGINYLMANKTAPKESVSKKPLPTETKEESTPSTKKKVKAFRTKGTTSSKLGNAQRGTGKYYALDKPFQEVGQENEVTEEEVEYDETTTLDITTEEGMNKYNEIVSKLPTSFETIEEMNQAKADAVQEAGYTALIGNIENENKDAGRELVIYEGKKKPTESKPNQEKEEKALKFYNELTLEQKQNPDFYNQDDFKLGEKLSKEQVAKSKPSQESEVFSTTGKGTVKEGLTVDETPIPVTELSNEDIQEELAETEVTEARKSELIGEQVKRNKVAEKKATETQSKKEDELLSFLDDFDVKEQRERPVSNVNDNSLISDNPKLYKKIKAHFGKIFPNLSVKEVENLGNKYGAKILARIVKGGIEINKNEAIQSSLIHEYAHVYLEVLGDNHPLVKLGYQMIEGTQFDEDAKRLYPDKTRKEQLNEALTEALAQDSLSKLKTKFEGSALEKFKEFARKFWNKIKRYFTKTKSKDIIGILSDGLILNNKPYSVGVAALSGMNKDQRKGNNSPALMKTVDLVSSALTKVQVKSITDKDYSFDRKSKKDLVMNSVAVLMKRYIAEKEGEVGTNTDLIFDGIDLDLDTELTYKNVIAFGEELKNNHKEIYERVDRVVNSMLNTNIELVEEVVDEGANQDVDGQSDSSNNAIKASKKINKSVRAILSMMVDEEGFKMNPDLIYQYISNASQKSYKQAGLKERLKIDSKADNIIATRLLDTMSKLDSGQEAGIMKTLSSLIQQVYEGTNIQRIENENGEISYRLTNQIKNKDKELGGIKGNFESWVGTQDGKFFKDIYSDNMLLSKITRRDVNDLKPLMEQLTKLFGVTVDATNINSIIDSFETKKKSADESFYNAMTSQFDSFASFFNGNHKAGKEMKWNDIEGWANKIYEGASDDSVLKNTFLNGSGNTVSSTQTGHWVSELNSMLENDNESGRMIAMENSPVYKNNSVLKYFKKKGKVKYVKHDSMKNLNTLENLEYSEQNKNDYHINQLFKFAATAAQSYYNQNLGVMSNRDSALMFEVPTYTKAKLEAEYKTQAAGLESMLKQKMKGLTTEQEAKMVDDFNKLYIHQADSKGNVTPGTQLNHKAEIKEIKDLLLANNLATPLSQTKVGKGKTFANLDELLENYFYTESLNRTYLNDIYGGSAIHFSNPNSNKGAVEQSIKRLSGPSSNGEIIELDRPVMMVFYDGGKPENGDFVGDSFNFNGTELSKKLQEMSGSLDPMGINSKDQVYQVDPETGKSFYLKRSSLNIQNKEGGGTNIDGMGIGYAKVANLIKNIEKQNTKDGVVPYVMLMDSSSTKGSDQSHTIHDFNTLVKQGEEQKLPEFKSVELNNYRVLFNINKTLKSPSEQNAIFSTQAANIQFNNASQADIDAYETAVVNYLKSSLRNSKTLSKLMGYNSTTKELTKDLEDREKTSTSELLEGIENYNKNNPNSPIESFDHPSLRLIYEQFVSSRLTKKGLKLDMAGNFMHQLPDMNTNPDTKLKGFEVDVSYKMFADTLVEAEAMLAKAKAEGKKLEVAVVRIPASAEMSMFAGEVRGFLDTDASMVVLSDKFVHISDSDHDGDKAMVYRKEIKEDGTFEEFSPKTNLFKHFYKNISGDQFVENSLTKTLDFDGLTKVLEELDIKAGGSYSSSTINQLADIATKMKMGAESTGRFAIASKMMAYLSQSGEGLIKPIEFGTETLQKFSNKSLDKLAVFLQAALDIGNDPILPLTGFNGTTIDVGNAMLLLGLNDKQIIEFLTSDSITKMVDKFDSKNLVLAEGNKVSFNQFFKNEYLLDESGNDVIPQDEMIAKYAEFKEVSDGLSKIISYVQLDKGLPNNAALNTQLLEGIKDFRKLPFTTENLTSRIANKYRVGVAESQGDIYQKHLLTANDQVNSLVEKLSKNFSNSFEFKKRFKEQLMMSIAQRQISKQRDDVEKFIYEFSGKMKSIYDGVVLGKTDSSIPQSTIQMLEDVENAVTIEDRSKVLQDIATMFGTDVDSVLKSLEARSEEYKAHKSIDKFKDNTFFKNLQFKPKTKGSEELVVSLNPQFKATEETRQEFIKGFEEIQKIDPDLAKEIIDYQLYRYGTNNKIGSFIDGLPTDISLTALKAATKIKASITDTNTIQEADSFINADGSITEQSEVKESKFKSTYANQISDNLIGANADLLKEISYQKDIKKLMPNGDIEADIEGDYFSYQNNAYKRVNQSDMFSKIDNFESDANFTAYNVSETNSATQAQIDEIKKCI